MKEIIQQLSETRADVRNLTYEIGSMQKSFNGRLDKIEIQLEKQRVADAAHEKEMAVVTTKTNVVWDFLWNRGGFALIIVLAYVVLGQRV